MAERNLKPVRTARLIGVLMPESSTRNWTNGTMWQPRADIYESRDALLFQIEVPGMEISHLRILFESESLIIEGVRPQTECSPTNRCLQVETESGAFRRVFALPREVDGGAIEAHLESGILHVSVPKRTAEERRTVKIEIG
ncbi:MAG TPA: Hsp20/alpha crystallin family protein [Abditibacteriaceae bacterium]|jgi:HSP20 family protein|nr:Hsp20/alpha crystallin family protein [Abditibacteriaceae bacterium]